MNVNLSFHQQDIYFCTKEDIFQKLQDLFRKETVLFLASDSAVKRYSLEPIVEILLKQKGVHWHKIQPNPSVELVAEILDFLQNRKFTVVVALGGGSCIDLAKAYCAFANEAENASTEKLRERIECKKYIKETMINYIPLYAIPTTAGTGSEVTQWATIWDTKKNKKLSVDADFLLPEKAWICPELTYDASALLTLSTGLDALSHAMESCWVKANNPYSFALAKKAIEIVADALPSLLKSLQDTLLREKMAQAALLAGLAFAQTRTGAAHAISYALTLQYNIPHGIAAAISLPEILDITKEAKPELATLEIPFEKYGGFATWIRNISQPIFPMSLSEFSVPKSEVQVLAKKTLQTGRMENNLYLFTQEKLQELLLSIY